MRIRDWSSDVCSSDLDRVARMSAELATGFADLRGVTTAVSIFGSARAGSGTAEYAAARAVADALGRAGFAVITGGGPGVMEAANRGARDAGALSIGLTLDRTRVVLGQRVSVGVDLGV